MTDIKEDSSLHFGKLNFHDDNLKQQVLARIGRDRSNEPVNIYGIETNPNGRESTPTSGFDFEGKEHTHTYGIDVDGYDPEPFDGFDHEGENSL